MAVAFGRYQLLKKIASGGMGQVFLARTAQAGFEKLVVIKRILPHLVEDEEFLEMFFDEAKIAARLNHPNLVQIFELGEVEGMHFLAMEFVQGDDVRRVEKASRKQQKPLPLGVTCRIVADAAAGLDYAHKLKDSGGRPLKLIHRDVSPQNILVGFDGGVKLIDFGVARAAGRMQHTATGILKGKYPYMSPEQIAGEEYDHTSDQFALAIVFWEILTGRRLFKGDSDLVTMRLVRECNVPAPSSLNPSLPRELDAIILKALAAKAKDRFADTGAFRMALEDFTVHHRLPATPAHLSAYMQDLFRERIDSESDLSTLDELTGPSAFEEDSSSKQPSNSRASAQAAPMISSSAIQSVHEPVPAAMSAGSTEARAQKTGHGTQALTRPGAKKRGLGAPVIAGIAVVVIGAAVAIPLALRSDGHDQQRPPGFAEVVVVPPPVKHDDAKANLEPPDKLVVPVKNDPPPAPAQKSVAIQLVTTPAGAEVTIDGVRMGFTPLALTLPDASATKQAVLTLAGYEPQKATLTASAAPEFAVELVKKKRTVPGHPKHDDDNKPPLGIKTGR